MAKILRDHSVGHGRHPRPTDQRQIITATSTNSSTSEVLHDSSRSNNSSSNNRKDEEYQNTLTSSLAEAETRVVSYLRGAILLVLLVTGSLACYEVYRYTSHQEHDALTSAVDGHAHQVLDNFHTLLEHYIGAVSALSTDMTSYALHTNQSFPFVTVPDFELKGAHMRTLSGAFVVQYQPVITQETRQAWEEYAQSHRSQIDQSYTQDQYFWHHQNDDFGIPSSARQRRQRQLVQADAEEHEDPANNNDTTTILDDGTGYRLSLWYPGPPVRDVPHDDQGPWMPGWQRSPVNEAKQASLNLVPPKSPQEVQSMMQEKHAFLDQAVKVAPVVRARQEANLRLSQYRQRVDEYLDDGLTSFLNYPIFDSFDLEERQVVGILGTNIYWKIFLSHLLPSHAKGIVFVVENNYNQTFAYRIDGPKATFLGMEDPHDPKYDEYEDSEDITAQLQQRASPLTRAYTTVPLSGENGYRIRVYPSQETEDLYVTNQPLVYTMVVMVSFFFCAMLFLLFSYVVERRHYVMMMRVVENAGKATAAERELNEFLAHEVRNPLSAAMTAGSFISAAVNEPEPLTDLETTRSIREDIEVVMSSLCFVNDFLRNIIDIYRVNNNKMKLTLSPTDIRRDVFDPVLAILYRRMSNFEVVVECPVNLMVMSDSIRLKQVVLNLVCNASNFVQKGFVRMRAQVVNGNVQLYVEDSGPGIPMDKQKYLFCKYHANLDLLSQGTGVGLNLSKKLMEVMGGDLRLDALYQSGIDNCPGACFVVELGVPPMDLDAALNSIGRTSHLSHVSETEDIPTVETKPTSAAETLSTSVHQTNLLVTKSLALPPSLTDHTPPSMVFAVPNPPATEPPPPPPISLSASPPSAAATPTNNAASPSILAKSEEAPPPIDLPTDISVLFVDDDTVLRKLFARAIRKAAPSWNVSEASSGEAALHMCDELAAAKGDAGGGDSKSFDLIFLDQYMASTNKQLLGTEVAQAMRLKGMKSKLVGLSANDLGEAFLRAGADAFLLKPMPCKPAALRQVLWDILCQNNGVDHPTAHGEHDGRDYDGTVLQSVLWNVSDKQPPNPQQQTSQMLPSLPRPLVAHDPPPHPTLFRNVTPLFPPPATAKPATSHPVTDCPVTAPLHSTPLFATPTTPQAAVKRDRDSDSSSDGEWSVPLVGKVNLQEVAELEIDV